MQWLFLSDKKWLILSDSMWPVSPDPNITYIFGIRMEDALIRVSVWTHKKGYEV